MTSEFKPELESFNIAGLQEAIAKEIPRVKQALARHQKNSLQGYRYQHVENALAVLFQIQETRRPAFRARIRHLRNIGVPDLPKVGSGVQIAYSSLDALKIAVALDLENMGVVPRVAADFVKSHFDADEPSGQRTCSRFSKHFWNFTELRNELNDLFVLGEAV